jgi:hypothetical protein
MVLNASKIEEPKKPGSHDKIDKLNIFVNQKKYEVDADAMTPRQILSLAEENVDQVVLALKEKGQLNKYKNLDESIPLRSGMHFVTMDTTPTPVS